MIKSDVRREYENAINFCVSELITNYMGKSIQENKKQNLYELRKILNNTLTKYSNKIPNGINEKLDVILQYELSNSKIIIYKQIPMIKNYPVSLWKGDITTINIDCIVNAANNKGLGCFIPNHKCIDNVIHSKAGPRMREECKAILQNNEIKSGELILTRGYNLPCEYVFHVVGPVYKGLESDKICLIKCYLNCLNKLKDIKKNSIAFCCISTGEYGYPKKDAAWTAVNVIKRWLLENKYNLHIIFCVYTEEDLKYYNNAISKILF